MNRILEILKTQGRSQTWLAKQIGYSYAITTNYCNNKTQPDKVLLRKIAALLEVDVKELLLSSATSVISDHKQNDGPSLTD